MGPMRTLADSRVSYAAEAYAQFGEVTLFELPLDPELTRDVDILIMRSDLRIDGELLALCTPRFLGCPTVGTDHVDFDYLRREGIEFAHAPGCNSDAVKEYVMAAILLLAVREGRRLSDITLGVVGVGRIGNRVARAVQALGMKVFLNDPPRARLEPDFDSLPLDELMDVDLLTLHVPLNPEGRDRTLHLFDRERLGRLRRGTILINTCRGPVVDNAALGYELEKGRLKAVLDIWENEPKIDIELLERVEIGTAHVAGQTIEARVRGADTVYRSCCRYLGVEPRWSPPVLSQPGRIRPPAHKIEFEEALNTLVRGAYDIEDDDRKLRGLAPFPELERIERFHKLRRTGVHREFSSFGVDLPPGHPLADACRALGFRVSGASA